MRLGLGLGLSARSGVSTSFSVSLTGLSSDSIGTYAQIGNEASIGYTISPDNGTDTVAWDDNNPNSGSDYGTGANPTSIAALTGSTLYCHVTDGADTVTRSMAVRYAPGSAAGALSDQNGWVEGVAITTVDPTGDFTLTNLTGTWSALGLPTGLSINSGTGAITGTPATNGSGSITVTFTDQYGRTVSSGFSYTVAAVTVPDAFVDANWSVATGSGANELDITITTLPADNNGAITNVQYDIDGSGTWLNISGYAGTGTYTVTMAAASTSYDIRLRAVNSAGNGAAGNTESATSGAGAATVPSAFVDADWSVAAGSDHKDLDITIATLPNNGGAAITDIEYDVDASGSWVSLGTAVTGTTTVTMAAGNTSYAIRLRAVNSVGNATAGNSESATSKALTITGYSFNGTDTISFSLNGTGTLYTSTTAATETDAADIEGGVGAIDTDTDVLSSGTNNITVSYPNTFDDNWLNLVAKSGSEYSNVISNQYTFGDIVPRAFVDANWSVATGSGANELDVTIASLPSSGGATITDVEYDVDGGDTWTSLGATTGTITITMAAASTSYGIRLRGVNSVGNGLAGNTESATSGSAGDVTAPTLSSPTDAANGQNASTGSVSTNEGNGTLYWVVTTSATAPSAAQVKAGQDNTSTAATASGSQSVSGTGVQTLSPAPSGLTASTAYTTHFMHEDAATNQSTVSSASGFTTAAASGITRVQAISWDTDAANAPNPKTASITPTSTANVIVAFVCVEHNATTGLDTSMDTGGANVPTLGGNTMVVGELANRSRRHAGIYAYHPNSTSAQTFSLPVSLRGAAVMLAEYSGVDTTTIFNANTGSVTVADGNVNPTLTTVDAGGYLVGCGTYIDVSAVPTVTTGTEIGTAGVTGADAKDLAYIAADIAVASAGATEGVAFNQTTGGSETGVCCELNPA